MLPIPERPLINDGRVVVAMRAFRIDEKDDRLLNTERSQEITARALSEGTSDEEKRGLCQRLKIVGGMSERLDCWSSKSVQICG